MSRGLAYRKHPRVKDKRPIVQKYRGIQASNEAKAVEAGLGWRIVGATILHRYPVILPLAEPWEYEMEEIQDKIGLRRRQMLMDEVGGTDAQFIPEVPPSIEDIMASMPFQPASRTTEADLKDDRKSIERKLDQSLFLIVKRNRDANSWQFPQGKLQDDETLRKAAERVIDRATGSVKRWFISNAPCGHYLYNYPADVAQQRQQYGAKVFFSRCQYLGGPIKLETRLYKDFAWISREEVDQYFNPETAEYVKALLPN